MHHVHDNAEILTEAMHYADPAYLQSYTLVVEGLSTWNVISPIGSQKHGSRVALQLTVRSHSHNRNLAMRRLSHSNSRTSGQYKTNANLM